jgi:hypothetical protein
MRINETTVRLGISDKKNSVEDRKTKQIVCSDRIPVVPQNRKLSEFLSESFRRREKCSEFRTVEQT